MRDQLLSVLKNQLPCYDFSLSDEQLRKLVDFVLLFSKWNRAYNLSAIREPHDILRRHIFDSLSIVPYVNGSRIADVGTGGGLPGIPLAIVKPESEFALIDSNGKKTRFLTQVKIELGLSNVAIFNQRVEQHQPPVHYDVVVSRAFADVATTLDLLDHLWTADGKCLMMKGPNVFDELKHLPDKYQADVIELNVPDTPEQRFLLHVTKTGESGK